MRTLWVIAVFAACFASPAWARDIFVDNTLGDDLNRGETQLSVGPGNGPCRSIGKALALAQQGDRVILANTGAPYRECITLQAGYHSGHDRQLPFKLVGNGAVLDGTLPVPESAWESFRGNVFRFRPRRMAHQILLMEDEPLMRKSVVGGILPELKPLEWCLFDGYVYFCIESDRLPQQYPLRYGGMQTGITLYDVHYLEISDLYVRGFQLDGINAHDNCCFVKLVNVASDHNGRSGFSVSGWCRTTLDECAASGNGVAQVRVDEEAILTLIGGKYAENGVPALFRAGGRVIRKDPPKATE